MAITDRNEQISNSPCLRQLWKKLFIRMKVLELTQKSKLGSVAGSVIQANGRLTFEDDLHEVMSQYSQTIC